MSFNVDDLASDNSLDNDFFETPVTSKKSGGKTVNQRKKLEDLFGIQEESEADVPSSATFKSNKPVAASTPRIVKQKPSLSQDDDDDDDDLGFDPKHPKTKTARNLFDDLLAPTEPKKNIFDDILNDSTTKQQPQQQQQRPATAKPSISRQSTDTTTDNSNVYSQTRPKTSTGRRSSAQSAANLVNSDPLGLFSSKEKEIQNANVSGMSTPVSKKRANTIDWLGVTGDPPIAAPSSPPPPLPKESVVSSSLVNKDTVEILRLADSDETELDGETPMQKVSQQNDSTAHNILLLNSMNLEQNNAIAALQQQESQLLIAAQMKNQERALSEMQRKQEQMLQQQEQKFHALVQQQLHRQQQMEENIKMQQQRINSHIQLFMTQPAAVPIRTTASVTDDLPPSTAPHIEVKEKINEQLNPNKDEQVIELENDVKRLQLEKLRLEELVANMKVNYEQEIELIDSTHKKQREVLEEHLTAIEQRLKTDNSEQKEHYEKKLSTLEKESQQLKNDYNGEISALKQDHEDEMRKLRKSQEVELEQLKEDHHRMLDTIRQSKLLEFAAVQENSSYLETLRVASSDLHALSGGLQGLRDEMSTKLETLNKERERKLDARERLLEDKERRLHIDEESADQEKKRLMELVSTLELQLQRMSKDTAEENWQLRQRMATVDAEKKALEREKEFHREQMERDEKRIEELKLMQLADTERMHLDLQQQRTRLAVERAQMELERKLHSQGSLDKERMELEAQMKVAQDAIRRADEERDRLYQQQRELEQSKRQLLEKQNTLNIKEDELAEASSCYRMATSRTQIAEHKAREGKQLLDAKLQLVTKRMQELCEKEAQVSQERMLLAQDRIVLHNIKQQISQSKCTLCKMSAERAEDTLIPPSNPNAANITPGMERHPLNSVQSDVVDRMMDENIAASFRRMYNVGCGGEFDYWPTAGLDDDSKKLALDNTNAQDRTNTQQN